MATVESFNDATLLIGLGPQRTGSRWISNYFYDHPNTLMSPIRVLHFFDRNPKWNRYYVERLAEAEAKAGPTKDGGPPRAGPGLEMLRERVRMNTNEGAYLEFFRKRWSGQPVFCDITPAYYALAAEDYARMRDHHRRVKFFLVLRNPVDRFWSEIRMNRTYDPQFDVFGRLDFLLERQKPIWKPGYVEAIERLDAVVSAQNAKIIFFEELFTSSVLDDFCQFLGIPPSPAVLGPPMNESEPHPLEDRRRAKLFKRLEGEYRSIFSRYDGHIPANWRNDLERFA